MVVAVAAAAQVRMPRERACSTPRGSPRDGGVGDGDDDATAA